ncbi:MAG: glycosyltransferase family 4 protein [Bacteroidales bacterium]|nr:glycosyltransferase family 4 protein [Bacteroidales bacterium]
MRIGFDAKRAFNNGSGLGNYSRDVIRALVQDSSHELFLFTPKQNQKFFNDEFPSSTKIIEPSDIIDQRIKSYWRSFSIVKDIRKSNLDLFHGLSNEIPFTLGKVTKTVVTIHDLIFKRFPQWYPTFDRAMYDWKFKSAAQNANRIVAISEQTKQDLTDFYKINPDRIDIVYQTCNERFKKEISADILERVRLAHRLPKNFLLYVGTIEARKNALEIVKAIHQFDIDIPLVIVGKSTAYADEIKQYIRQHNLESQVMLKHDVGNDDLPAIYQMASLFIYPSTFEGFGIPIIEALYSKIPVITSIGGCFAEAGGTNSKYVEVGNTEALAHAIRSVLDDSNLALNMKNSGYDYVQRFDREKVTSDLINVYQKTINDE